MISTAEYSMFITACSALLKGSVFGTVCDFMYEISPEPLNGFATNSHGRSVWYLAWTCLKVKVNFGGLHAVSLEKSVCFSFTSVLAHFLAVARQSVCCL